MSSIATIVMAIFLILALVTSLLIKSYTTAALIIFGFGFIFAMFLGIIIGSTLAYTQLISKWRDNKIDECPICGRKRLDVNRLANDLTDAS